MPPFSCTDTRTFMESSESSILKEKAPGIPGLFRFVRSGSKGDLEGRDDGVAALLAVLEAQDGVVGVGVGGQEVLGAGDVVELEVGGLDHLRVEGVGVAEGDFAVLGRVVHGRSVDEARRAGGAVGVGVVGGVPVVALVRVQEV